MKKRNFFEICWICELAIFPFIYLPKICHYRQKIGLFKLAFCCHSYSCTVYRTCLWLNSTTTLYISSDESILHFWLLYGYIYIQYKHPIIIIIRIPNQYQPILLTTIYLHNDQHHCHATNVTINISIIWPLLYPNLTTRGNHRMFCMNWTTIWFNTSDDNKMLI